MNFNFFLHTIFINKKEKEMEPLKWARGKSLKNIKKLLNCFFFPGVVQVFAARDFNEDCSKFELRARFPSALVVGKYLRLRG